MAGKCIAIFGKNEFANLQLILRCWIANLEIHVITVEASSRVIKIINRIPFIREYIKKSIKKHNVYVSDYKGLWYKINEETVGLTTKFYDEKLKTNGKIITYYNKIFNTNKFEAYIKKQISIQIFNALKDLHFIRLSYLGFGNILINKNPINEFIIAYMERKYGIKYHITWILPGWELFSLFVYYGWLFIEFMRRGIVFNKERKNYKLSMEAVWGFYPKTLRNDILIDNVRIKLKDVLILQLVETNHPQRIITFNEAKKRGFNTASLPDLKININKNIFALLSFYFSTPVKIFLRLFSEQQLYLFYYIFLFHKRCFPVELLVNLYNIKCWLSIKDWGDIEETIILNKYGTKSAIFHWSDLTFHKSHAHAFIAHNVYYAWGDIHHVRCLDTYFVNKKVNIGCIYKKAFSEAAANKNGIISRIPNFKKEKKVVTFYDTSFARHILYTEDSFFEYMAIIKEYCERNKNVNVLLKPKTTKSYESRLSRANQNRFKNLWDELISYDNFNYLDVSKWSIEETIAISDVCISMGMTSPSTIALICGKDAFYFNGTGNVYHPFAARYKDIIAFDDKELLCDQINKILDGKFNCKNVISEREIREYDAFSDDNALERLRGNLHELTL